MWVPSGSGDLTFSPREIPRDKTVSCTDGAGRHNFFPSEDPHRASWSGRRGPSERAACRVRSTQIRIQITGIQHDVAPPHASGWLRRSAGVSRLRASTCPPTATTWAAPRRRAAPRQKRSPCVWAGARDASTPPTDPRPPLATGHVSRTSHDPSQKKRER